MPMYYRSGGSRHERSHRSVRGASTSPRRSSNDYSSYSQSLAVEKEGRYESSPYRKEYREARPSASRHGGERRHADGMHYSSSGRMKRSQRAASSSDLMSTYQYRGHSHKKSSSEPRRMGHREYDESEQPQHKLRSIPAVSPSRPRDLSERERRVQRRNFSSEPRSSSARSHYSHDRSRSPTRTYSRYSESGYHPRDSRSRSGRQAMPDDYDYRDEQHDLRTYSRHHSDHRSRAGRDNYGSKHANPSSREYYGRREGSHRISRSSGRSQYDRSGQHSRRSYSGTNTEYDDGYSRRIRGDAGDHYDSMSRRYDSKSRRGSHRTRESGRRHYSESPTRYPRE